MTTCTRYPCGGTRHGCPMDDCPGRRDTTALAVEEERRVIPGREDWYLLAHELEQARDAYLNGFGQQGNAERKAKLEQLLWNDKGGIVLALRAASLSTPSASAGPQSMTDREAFEKWVKGRGGDVMKRDGAYLSSMTVLWWDCWRARGAASAGPQAVAVWRPILEAVDVTLSVHGHIDRDTDLHLRVKQALVEDWLYTHPQPQQADGRGAVIEFNPTDISDESMRELLSSTNVGQGRARLRKIVRALQQSPATDNAPVPTEDELRRARENLLGSEGVVLSTRSD